MSNLFAAAVVLLVSYFLGCINGSVMTSHFVIHDDVRQHGSGNAGLTNFYRTYGAKYALMVIAFDMGKTVVACLIGGYMFHSLLGDWTLGLLIAGIGCELGHMFPVFFGFRGGKGILSGGTIVLMLDWRVALVAWGLFVALDEICLPRLHCRHGEHARHHVFRLFAQRPLYRSLRRHRGARDLVPPRQHPASALRHGEKV